MAEPAARLLIHETSLTSNWEVFVGYINDTLKPAAENATKDPDQEVSVPSAPEKYPVTTVVSAIWGYLIGAETQNMWQMQPLKNHKDLTAEQKALARVDIANIIKEKNGDWQQATLRSNPTERRVEILLEVIDAVENWQPLGATKSENTEAQAFIEKAVKVVNATRMEKIWDTITPLLAKLQSAQKAEFAIGDLDRAVQNAYSELQKRATQRDEGPAPTPADIDAWGQAKSTWESGQSEWEKLQSPVKQLTDDYLSDNERNSIQALVEYLTKNDFTSSPTPTLAGLQLVMIAALMAEFSSQSAASFGFPEQSRIEIQIETWLNRLSELITALTKPEVNEFASRRTTLVGNTNKALAGILGVGVSDTADAGGGAADEPDDTDTETEEPEKTPEETEEPAETPEQPAETTLADDAAALTGARQPSGSRLLDTLPQAPDTDTEPTRVARLGELAGIQALLVRESELELRARLLQSFPNLPETELQNILNLQNKELSMLVWQEFLQHGGLSRGKEISYTELATIWLKSTDLIWTQIQLERGMLGNSPALFAQSLDTSSAEKQARIQAEQAKLQQLLLTELGYQTPAQLTKLFDPTLMAQMVATAKKLRDPAEGNKILARLFTDNPELNALRLRSLQNNPVFAMVPDSLDEQQIVDLMHLLKKMEEKQTLSTEEYQQLRALLFVLLPTMQLFQHSGQGIDEIAAVLYGSDALNEYAEQAKKMAPIHKQFVMRSTFPPAGAPGSAAMSIATGGSEPADVSDSPDYAAQNGRSNPVLIGLVGQLMVDQESGTVDPRQAYIIDEIIFQYVRGGEINEELLRIVQMQNAQDAEIGDDQLAALTAADALVGPEALAAGQQADAAAIAAERSPEAAAAGMNNRQLAGMVGKAMANAKGNPYVAAAQIGMQLMNDPKARAELLKKLGYGAAAAGGVMLAGLLPLLQFIKTFLPVINAAIGAIKFVGSVGSFIGNTASSIWGFISNPFGIFGGGAATTTAATSTAGAAAGGAKLGANAALGGYGGEATAAATSAGKTGFVNAKIAATDIGKTALEFGSKVAAEGSAITGNVVTAVTTTATLTATITAAFILTPVILLSFLTLIVLTTIGGSYNDMPNGGGSSRRNLGLEACWPAEGSITTLRTYSDGRSHLTSKNGTAIDISVSDKIVLNPPVYTPFAGQAKFMIDNEGYGNYVQIQTGQFIIILAHLQVSHIALGELRDVAAGEEIGLMGSTGNSGGQHVHYELIHPGIEVYDVTPLTEAEMLGGSNYASFSQCAPAINTTEPL